MTRNLTVTGALVVALALGTAGSGPVTDPVVAGPKADVTDRPVPAGLTDQAPADPPASWPDAKPPEVEPKSGRWGDVDLGDLVERTTRSRPAGGERHARAATIRVEVTGRSPHAARTAISSRGGEVVVTLGRWAVADLPASQVEALSRTAGVESVQLVHPAGAEGPAPAGAALSGANGGEPVAKTGVAAWHAAGWLGQGVKVGIIDYFDAPMWNAAVAAGELPPGAPPTACVRNVNQACDIWSFSSSASSRSHGVKVAEVIHDMAPGASLYLASTSGAYETRAIIDWFAANGVRIISRSLGASYDGPGNGTGPWAETVTYAESKGMAWFNAAGNSGGRNGRPGGYYRFAWNDPDNDGWMNFTATQQPLLISCHTLEGMRWSDWGADRTDYDLYVVDPSTRSTVYSSRDDQRAATPKPPVEGTLVGWSCTPGQTWYELWVQLYHPGSGTVGDILEISSAGFLSPSSNPFSAGLGVVDSRSPAMAAVGAVDPWNGTTIANYSSEGPTNDGRMKPELSAASNFSAFTGGSFSGTSAATPVVAGAAAVLLGASPASTAIELVSALKSAVVDRGDPGPDNVFGTGELTLPPPQTTTAPTPTPVPAIIAPSAVGRVRVTGISGQRVRFRWSPPSSTGGELTGYLLKVRKKGQRKPVVLRSTGPGVRSVTLKLRRLGTGRFKASVKAFNSAGSGPWRTTRFRVR